MKGKKRRYRVTGTVVIECTCLTDFQYKMQVLEDTAFKKYPRLNFEEMERLEVKIPKAIVTFKIDEL